MGNWRGPLKLYGSSAHRGFLEEHTKMDVGNQPDSEFFPDAPKHPLRLFLDVLERHWLYVRPSTTLVPET